MAVVDAPHSRDNALLFFVHYTRKNKDTLQNKIVVDLSAGSGYISHLFEETNSRVMPFDLFPGNNTFATATCHPIHLQEPFPIASAFADYVILAETIEHLPNQFFLFKEVARILKPGGRFLLTTPNSSSLRGRFSQFLTESEHYGSPPPNELTAYVNWRPGQNYFGKLFVNGVQRLRTLAAIHRLQLRKVYPSQRSSTSYLLLIFYPLIWFFASSVRKKQIKKDADNRNVYTEIFKLNTSCTIALSKHLLMEFERRG